jgi:acetoin utilization protein AcuB
MNRKAHQIMTRTLVTATPETSIEDAARLLVQNGVSCLPVVAVDGSLAGILSWKDLFKAFVSGLKTL